MFTVLGTWEVIGEVQGERYIQPLTLTAQGRGEMWRGRVKKQNAGERCKQRMAEGDFALSQVIWSSLTPASDLQQCGGLFAFSSQRGMEPDTKRWKTTQAVWMG